MHARVQKWNIGENVDEQTLAERPVQSKLELQNLPTPFSLPGLPGAPQQLVGVLCRSRGAARSTTPARSRPARSEPGGAPPSKSSGGVRHADSVSASNAAKQKRMRKSYDKCLTTPNARFKVLNKCPVS